MTKHDRLDKMYRHLFSLKKVSTQAEFAKIIKRDKTNINRALNGDDRYLTINLLHLINRSYGYIFNDDWIETGNGEFLNENNITSDNESQRLIKLLEETNKNIKQLIKLLEKK